MLLHEKVVACEGELLLELGKGLCAVLRRVRLEHIGVVHPPAGQDLVNEIYGAVETDLPPEPPVERSRARDRVPVDAVKDAALQRHCGKSEYVVERSHHRRLYAVPDMAQLLVA